MVQSSEFSPILTFEEDTNPPVFPSLFPPKQMQGNRCKELELLLIINLTGKFRSGLFHSPHHLALGFSLKALMTNS